MGATNNDIVLAINLNFNFIPETKVWPSRLASAVRVHKMEVIGA